MPLFDQYFIKTDVTSIKLHASFILVGIGGYLHVYSRDSTKLINKKCVFDGENISGIVPNDKNEIIVYGGTHVKILHVDNNFSVINFKGFNSLWDWILYAKWINDDNNVATVSMHNKFQVWNLHLEKEIEIECEEKCILYSAHITLKNYEEVIVLSGTVFSEILIWKPCNQVNGESKVFKRLQGHKGVIFSIDYNPYNGIISSSSDDRSTILWRIENECLSEDSSNIIKKSCQVFGHSSRVFRNCILNNYLITAGEDSVVNIWALDGKLIRKIDTYQGDTIWAIDCSEMKNMIVVGSSDGGLTIYPMNCNFFKEILTLSNPKISVFMRSGGLVALSESGEFYYRTAEKNLLKINQLDDLKNYAIMETSKCRTLVALAGFQGQIYIFKESCNEITILSSFLTKCRSRIFAFHWLTCEIFLICQKHGQMTLFYIKNKYIYPIFMFVLPTSKERWSTAATFVGKNIIVGDRKGNVHVFEVGSVHPKQTLKRVHNHLGVTNIIARNNQLVSLGRNGIIKTFVLKDNLLILISSDKTPFTWLVDIVDNLLLAFSGNHFVICEYKTKKIVWKTVCGGGHRSWDLIKDTNNLAFSYIKDKSVHYISLDLNIVLPKDLMESYHVKEINCLNIIKSRDMYVIISGGEDTTLRVNLFQKHHNFINIITLKSHLSSIRALTSYEIDVCSKTSLVFSAGGRAQVICWKLHILDNNQVSCSEQHSYYRIIHNKESEMRVMTLNVTYVNNELVLFCGCSDGNIQIFRVQNSNGVYQLIFIKNIFYKMKCILKLCIVQLLGSTILVTMATDGKMVFWNIEDMLLDIDTKPFFSFDCHQSGINSCSYKLFENNVLFLTGGDDNAIILNYISFSKTDSGLVVELKDTFTDISGHCAQITGACITNKYFITASLDQRIAVFSWRLKNEKLYCAFISQYKSSISDIQGIACYNDSGIDTFIYGKGIEAINVKPE